MATFRSALLIFATLLSTTRAVFADEPLRRVDVDAESVAAFIESCRKSNGAFGPADQEYTDAAWNYPAVHTLRLLNSDIPDQKLVLKHGLAYPRGHAGYGHWLVFHQMMIRWLLTSDDEPPKPVADRTRPPVRLVHQGSEVRYYGSPFGIDGDDFFKTDGESTSSRFHAAKEVGYYNLSSLYYLLSALAADGRDVANREELIRFIRARQAPNGGFVDLRGPEVRPGNSETHVAHTYHAVGSLILLRSDVPRAGKCVEFVRACQSPAGLEQRSVFGTGGFLFDPDVNRPGNYPDVYYTFAGLQVLHLLNARPADASACTRWLVSLQNFDGGFGDRPDWRSRLYSTYYAMHSLAMLTDMQSGRRERNDTLEPLAALAGTRLRGRLNDIMPVRRRPIPQEVRLNDGSLRVHQALFKTPVVEPADLHGLKQRGFDLLAMKTDDFSLAEPLLQAKLVSSGAMNIVLCPEAYPHRLRRSGGAVLHHVGNFTLNPGWTPAQRAVWQTADAAGRKELAWPDYQRQVLSPMTRLGSLCYPEQDFEMEFAMSAYDDGVYGKGGYNAVQAGFNWSPRDFVRVFPWRERYTDKLPVVADADAHGDLAKWSPQLDHTRHLFISDGGSYADFLDAARHGRVVCVVVGADGVPSGFCCYGPASAVHYVKERVDEWKWW